MSATATAATSREININERITALYESATGKIEFQYRNEQGDFALASSFWTAGSQMSEDAIKAFFNENKCSIRADFDEALAIRF